MPIAQAPTELLVHAVSMVQKRCLVLLVALLTLLFASLTSAHAQDEIFIRFNQVGYRPTAPKIAIAFSRKQLPETFSIIDSSTKETAFTAPLKPISGSWGEFDYHGEIDFSGLNRPGRFVIQAGTVHSAPFEINSSALSLLPDQMLEFMRQQRCGYNPWLDAVCHSFELLAGYYRESMDLTVKASEGNPYRLGVPFIWCSNNLVVALATQVLLYERMTGDRSYQELAAKQIDWLLGRNPWGFSMFTQIPADGVYPRDVHLMPNSILKREVRGGLVDGPVYRRIFASLRGVSITEPDPLAAFQDERAVYHDDIKDYSTNEPTMDGTASAILLFALQ